MTFASITFDLDSSDYTVPLGFDVLLDNTIVFTTDHVTVLTPIKIEISEDEGQHELKLVLKNKKSEHTKIDVTTGDIIRDAVLSINNIKFDNFNTTYEMLRQFEYYHSSNNELPAIKNAFYGDMGCNGYVSLKFTTPMFIWLLEYM